VWHHDGPFDACRPHRNSKKNALAPINAFPTNSANNTIGGSGPVNPGINLEQFHGMGVEGFHDYGTVLNHPAATNPNKPFITPAVVNPINRVEPVHGEESLGLGTSTFLEGAPASRQAIQRTQSEQNQAAAEAGVMRKKSIAMRLRGMSNSRRYPDGYPGPSGPTSPPPALKSPTLNKGRFQDRSGGVTLSDGALASPDALATRPATAGGRGTEKNPFDSLAEEDSADTKTKAEARISVAEADDEFPEGRERALSSPRRGGLERRATTDMDDGGAKASAGTGFLSRVKSLKGPRRKPGDRQAS
jgi:Pal1 cell morphology protein